MNTLESINTAEELVNQFALLVRGGAMSLSDVETFVFECTEDHQNTEIVMEKVAVLLECWNIQYGTAK